MANRMLTSEQIVELVRREVVNRGIVPAPSIFIAPEWCPERLYVGTAHTALTSAARILTPELFGVRIIRPLLDNAVPKPIAIYSQDDSGMRAHDALLDQRGATHGDYRAMSTRIQQIKAVMRMGSKWVDMAEPQKEALELIATKIGRIIEGDPEFKDHFKDIAGYAELGAKFCRPE